MYKKDKLVSVLIAPENRGKVLPIIIISWTFWGQKGEDSLGKGSDSKAAHCGLL